MKNYATGTGHIIENGWSAPESIHGPASGLHLITPADLEDLRNALMRGTLPGDLGTKLTRLSQGSLLHRSVEQNCRLFIALLVASEQSSFNQATRAQIERLLRVLAYVRKEEDVIADYKPNGFVDDQQEVRAAAAEFDVLLKNFKAWRLRTQVPALWPG